MKKRNNRILMYVVSYSCVFLLFAFFVFTLKHSADWYENKKFSEGGQVVIAKIMEKNYSNDIKRGWRSSVDIRFYINDKVYVIIKEGLKEKYWDNFKAGDCIEIYVAAKDPTVFKWNQTKEPVRCPNYQRYTHYYKGAIYNTETENNETN